MEFSCKKCGKCCSELNFFIVLEDIQRWTEKDNQEILASLAWHRFHGRNPEDMIFIPKKENAKVHSVLKEFFIPEWEKNKECIFLKNNFCSIYETRPIGCSIFPRAKLSYPCPGKSNVSEQDKITSDKIRKESWNNYIKIYKNREMISKVLRMSKETFNKEKLRRLIN